MIPYAKRKKKRQSPVRDINLPWKLDKANGRWTQDKLTRKRINYNENATNLPRTKSEIFYQQFANDEFIWTRCSKVDAKRIIAKCLTKAWFVMTKPDHIYKNCVILIFAEGIDIELNFYYKLPGVNINRIKYDGSEWDGWRS